MKSILPLIFCGLLLGLCQVNGLAQALNAGEIESLETQLSQQTAKDSVRIDLLLRLANAYNFTDPRKVRSYGEEAIACARQYGNTKWLAETLVVVAALWTDLSDYQNAATILIEALDISRKYNYVEWERGALCNLSILYEHLEAPDKALKYMLQAYQVTIKLNNPRITAETAMNVAKSYTDNDQYEKALIECKKSIPVLYQTQSWLAYAAAYSNLGTIYGGLKRYPEAINAFDSCQIIADKYEVLPSLKIDLSLNKALFYLNNLNQPETTIQILNKTLDDYNLDIPVVYLARIHQALAKAYFRQNQIQAAIEQALNSNLNNDKLGTSTEISVTNYNILAKCHAQLQHWQEAYRYGAEATRLNDSIGIRKKQLTAAYSLISHAIESSEAELNQRNNQLLIKQRIYETIAFLLVPLLIILAAAVYYRIKLSRSKERAKLQAEYTEGLEVKVTERTHALELAHKDIQEAKERENISLAMLNQQHSELLEITIEKMQNWQKQTTISEIQPTINELKTAKTKADEWGSFMLHFERIHPNFAKSLQVQFPELNANDLRHCAYMRLGMTRKQVADSLHSTDNAVKLARNRIRKKLGLDPDASLQDFLDQWQSESII